MLAGFRCRDFRASAIHEIGHLLSLDHSTGEDGTIPLSIDPIVQPPAPPPPPPSEPDLDPLSPYNPVPPYVGNWTEFDFRCDDPHFGVQIDPIATLLLSPPPPPKPPPSAPPPPFSPNATLPPPPAMPPLLPPNATIEAIANWTAGAYPPYEGPFSNETEPLAESFTGRMGSYLDQNGSVMLAFGSTGFERPIAGAPRRCLDQDDLNGINFLYPSCGVQLDVPPCEHHKTEWLNVSARLCESFIKLMALPVLIIGGMKILAYLILFLEDAVATWQVRREAKRLLDEAEAAEKQRRIDAGELEEEDAESPKRSPMRRVGFPGFGRASSKPKVRPCAAVSATTESSGDGGEGEGGKKKGGRFGGFGKKKKTAEVEVVAAAPAAAE